MVVGVDKAGQQHLTPGAEDRDLRMLRDEFGTRADLGDDAVVLEDRTVVDLTPAAAVGGLGENAARADDAGGHVLFSRRELRAGSCEVLWLIRNWGYEPPLLQRGLSCVATSRRCTTLSRPPRRTRSARLACNSCGS